MKLFYSAASPYVRKVIASAIACGLDSQIEKLTTDPWQSPQALLAQNPLSKVPCLVTDDGVALFDSPVICEYLDHVGSGALFPPPGPARWRALKLQAIGDGILDAAILYRRDAMRPEEAARTTAMQRYWDTVTHALDELERDPPLEHLDIGTISVACALGYLDFRFAQQPWRAGRPHLEAWYSAMETRPELAGTRPS